MTTTIQSGPVLVYCDLETKYCEDCEPVQCSAEETKLFRSPIIHISVDPGRR